MNLGAFGDEGDVGPEVDDGPPPCDCCETWDEFFDKEDANRAECCLESRVSGDTYRCGDCEYCRTGFDLCVPVPDEPCSCPGPRCSCITRPNGHAVRFDRVGVSRFLASNFSGEPSAPLRCTP